LILTAPVIPPASSTECPVSAENPCQHPSARLSHGMNGRIFTQQLFASRAAAKDQLNSFRVSGVDRQVRGIAAGFELLGLFFAHPYSKKHYSLIISVHYALQAGSI